MIHLVAIGDIVGKVGRDTLKAFLPKIRAVYDQDFTIVNGENAAGGYGLSPKIFKEWTEEDGIDVVTTGNHWHDKAEVKDLKFHPKLVLPANMANVQDPSQGYRILKTRSGHSIAVTNLIGRVFMHGENSDPFEMADKIDTLIPERVKLRVYDFHAEATSEKQALAHHLDGRASLIYGTHSHVPTADERTLSKGTGFITDLGMTGAYDSVIGMKKEQSIKRFLAPPGQGKKRLEPATRDPWCCFIVASLDPKSGRCLKIKRERWQLESPAKEEHSEESI